MTELVDRNRRLDAELIRAQRTMTELNQQVAAGRGYIMYLKKRLDTYDPEWNLDKSEPETKQQAPQ